MMVHHGMIFAALIIYLPARYRHRLTALSSAKYFLILVELFSPVRRHNGRQWNTVADQMTVFVTNIHENSSLNEE